MILKKLIFNLIIQINPNYYIKYLRKRGIVIGDKTVFYNPSSVVIDTRKPYLLKIGNYCKITDGVTILCHDYSISVARRVYGVFAGGTGPVSIGDNVFIGVKSTILAGTTIGDNCIVGANSLVKGQFPSNCVIAGNPARVICSLDEYYTKNLSKLIDNAKRCAISFRENSGKIPTIDDMSDGFIYLYLERTMDQVRKYNYFFHLSADDYDSVVKDFLDSKPVYSSFSEFLIDTFGDDLNE